MRFLVFILFIISLSLLGNSYSFKTFLTADSLKDALKEKRMWNLSSDDGVPRFLVKSFPDGLNKQTVSEKKKIFFHTLIPIILTVFEEIKTERNLLVEISNKTKDKIFNDSFFKKTKLSAHEKEILKGLIKKYKTDNLDTLLERIDIVPISLVLAQAGIESAWGTSRFCREVNNIFGIWTFKGDGITPKHRKKGLKHQIATYDSLLDSIRDYVYKLNTVKAYKKFRILRTKRFDSIYMASGLKHYSERKEAYVKDVVKMITKNRLQKYDLITLLEERVAYLLW
ncbi:glucosaminidase domain-containing protein [bacterium]|nr:glucosaminidase domain-containing protein [bacterium]